MPVWNETEADNALDKLSIAASETSFMWGTLQLPWTCCSAHVTLLDVGLREI